MDKNMVVFTTTYVVKMKSPIVYITHDEDGSWQFLSSEGADMKEVMLVRLGEIIEIDPSIRDVLYVSPNTEAHRSNIESEWVLVNKN